MAIEDYSRAPDYVTKQDHLPTKMDKRTLIPGRRGGGNHSKLADKGRVCLFVYLWGGGVGKQIFYIYILYLHFTLHFTEAVF